MIDLKVKGQELTMTHPVIVADTRDYIELSLVTEGIEWEGCRTWAHFEKSGVAFSEEFIEGNILKDKHIRLDAGTWKICVTGEKGTTLITTEQVGLPVRKTGTFDGAPFPPVGPSDTEKLMKAVEGAEATAQSVRDDADAGLFKGAKGDKGDKGDKGNDGIDGTDGADGHTPVKGVDYFTDSERAEFQQKVLEDTYTKGYIDGHFASAIKPEVTGNPIILKDSAFRPPSDLQIGGTTTQSPIRHLTAPVITADKVTGGQTAPTKLISDTVSDFSKSKVSVYGANIADFTTGNNMTVENGIATQVSADTRVARYWGIQGRRGGALVETYQSDVSFELGVQKATFKVTKPLDNISVGISGQTKDTRVYIRGFFPPADYSVSINITNTEQGTISWKDIMLNVGTSAKPYVESKPPQVYTPQPDGTVLNVQTIDGNMTVLSDTEGVDVDMIIPEPIRNADLGMVHDTGKNLAIPNLFGDGFVLQADGSYKSNGFVAEETIPYPLPPNTYSLSVKIKSPTGKNYRLAIDYEDGTFEQSFVNSTGDYKEYTLSTNGKSIKGLRWIYSSVSNDVWYKDLQINYGEPTPYEPFKGFIQSLSQRYSLSKWDRIFKDETGWKTDIQTAHIPSYNGETITGEYISSTGELLTGAEVYYRVPSVITPLPQEDADILDRIATYYPNTVVQTDGGIITLKYVADLLNYIDGRYVKATEHTDSQVMSLRDETDAQVTEVRNAILSTGGNI